MLRMVCGVVVVCFFFKHKTAYELRISDWSSDVCASDLLVRVARRDQPGELGEALHQHLQRDGRGHRLENAGNGAFDLVLAAVEQFLEQLFAGTQADEPDRHVDLRPQTRDRKTHVRTPVTNVHIVGSIRREKKKQVNITHAKYID